MVSSEIKSEFFSQGSLICQFSNFLKVSYILWSPDKKEADEEETKCYVILKGTIACFVPKTQEEIVRSLKFQRTKSLDEENELLKMALQNPSVDYFAGRTPLYRKSRSMTSGECFGNPKLEKKKTETMSADSDVWLLSIDKDTVDQIHKEMALKMNFKLQKLTEMFPGVSLKGLQSILDLFQETVFRPCNTVVFSRGSVADGAYLVAHGEVQIFAGSNDLEAKGQLSGAQKPDLPLFAQKDVDKTIKSLNKIGFIGQGGVLGIEERGNQRQVTAVTSQMNTVLYKVDYHDLFEVICKQYPNVFEKIMSMHAKFNEFQKARASSIKRLAEKMMEEEKTRETRNACEKLIRKPKPKTAISKEPKAKKKVPKESIPTQKVEVQKPVQENGNETIMNSFYFMKKRKESFDTKLSKRRQSGQCYDTQRKASANSLKDSLNLGQKRLDTRRISIMDDEDAFMLKSFCCPKGDDHRNSFQIFAIGDEGEVSFQGSKYNESPNNCKKLSLFRVAHINNQEKELKRILQGCDVSQEASHDHQKSFQNQKDIETSRPRWQDSPVLGNSMSYKPKRFSLLYDKINTSSFMASQSKLNAHNRNLSVLNEKLVDNTEIESKMPKQKHKKTQSLGAEVTNYMTQGINENKEVTDLQESMDFDTKDFSKCLRTIKDRMGVEIEQTMFGRKQNFEKTKGMNENLENKIELNFGENEGDEKTQKNLNRRILARSSAKCAIQNYLIGPSKISEATGVLQSIISPVIQKRKISEKNPKTKKKKKIVNHHMHPEGNFTNSCSPFRAKEILRSQKGSLADIRSSKAQTSSASNANGLYNDLKITKMTEESKKLELGVRNFSDWSSKTIFLGSFDNQKLGKDKSTKSIHKPKEGITAFKITSTKDIKFKEFSSCKKFEILNTKNMAISIQNSPVSKGTSVKNKGIFSQRMSMPNSIGFFKELLPTKKMSKKIFFK